MDTKLEGNPVPLPRDLILAACLWIAGAWTYAIGLGSPVNPVAASYSDALVMMCLLAMFGITLGWPLLRMCGTRFTRPFTQTWLDMIVLTCAIQVTIWPLRLLSTWSVSQTILISCALVAWMFIAGAFVLVGASSRRGSTRSLVMLCLMILITVGSLVTTDGAIPWWSPLDSIVQSTKPDTSTIATENMWAGAGPLVSTMVAAAGFWLVASGALLMHLDSGVQVVKRVESTS